MPEIVDHDRDRKKLLSQYLSVIEKGIRGNHDIEDPTMILMIVNWFDGLMVRPLQGAYEIIVIVDSL
ncbi:hypothetical protein [Leptodesmis sichuanensis]|uniref:hypothetical protein n=1 Tax=Leptodesmis sichuanensis TaxID=2906798 RepID=UPI001F38581A|nr:hypothetical protein [Leptodesmis sichuanensis]UIE38343.1 hypothetical protein KIK02_01380 [Leptodesmis sichuanensis A121]